MGNRLKDKVAIVTGAGRGLGEHIARAYCREGAQVVLTARSDDEIQGVASDLNAAGLPAFAVSGDVRDEEDVRAVFSRARAAFGPVDILVNNAGANQFEALHRNDGRGVGSHPDDEPQGRVPLRPRGPDGHGPEPERRNP